MKKIEIIDFLKGYSIFTIVFFHYLQYLHLPHPMDDLINFGGTGVHLFILLSGFGLYFSYLNKPESYLNYIRKRFSKVYIPYVLAVMLTIAISYFLHIYEINAYTVLGHIFLYKMFDEAIDGSYGYPLWFISMIFQFYFAFYIIIFLKKRIKNLSFIFICLVISLFWSLIVSLLGKEMARVWNSFFLQYLWEFALGMVIASLVSGNSQLKINFNLFYVLGISIVCCAIYGFLAMSGKIGRLFNDVPALIGYTFLGIWLYFLENNFLRRFLLFTGKISYSLYLLHILIFSIMSIMLKNLNLSVVVIISLSLSYLLAYCYQQAMCPIYKKMHI